METSENYDVVTMERCEEEFEINHKCTVIENGHVVEFIKED